MKSLVGILGREVGKAGEILANQGAGQREENGNGKNGKRKGGESGRE